MNKLVRMAVVAIGVGAMLGIAGCGGDIDAKYEKILREMAKDNTETFSVNVEKEMTKFKAMTPEQKEKEYKMAKAMFDAMKD